MTLQRKAATVLASVMLSGLTACGTLPKSNATGSPQCRGLAAELATAKTPQQIAETKEAGIGAGCWPRG